GALYIRTPPRGSPRVLRPGYRSTRTNCWGTPFTPLRYSGAIGRSAVSCGHCLRLFSVRVVSLLASATEIVCALDAGEMLVGRSHECDNPPWVRRLPACSEPAFDVSVSSGEIDAEVRRRLRASEPLYNLHSDLIRELAPDLILTQAHCEVCAVTPGDVERSGACGLAVDQLSLSASSIEGIFGGIQQVAERLGLVERGRALIERERRRLRAVSEQTARFCRPTVVMME